MPSNNRSAAAKMVGNAYNFVLYSISQPNEFSQLIATTSSILINKIKY